MRDFSLKVGGPDAIRVKCCQSCNRTGLFVGPLRSKHYAMSGLCPGPIVDVVYERVTP